MPEDKEELSEVYTLGLADWLLENVDAETSNSEAAALLEQYAHEYELLTPDHRSGISISQAFEKLVNIVRRRELISDEGIQEASFPLYTFHVPPGGQGSITWTQETSSSEGLILTLFGTGLGGRLKKKFTKSIELYNCKTCQKIRQYLEVRLRRYRLSGNSNEEELMIDPVRLLHHEPEACSDCCGIQTDALNLFKYDLLPEGKIDTTKTEGLFKVSKESAVEFGSSSGLQLDISSGIKAGFDLKTSGSLSCKMHWQFPPGTFIPYVNRERHLLPPKWSVS